MKGSSLTLSLSLLSLLFLSYNSVSATSSFCGIDLSVNNFVFQVPVPGQVPVYKFYFNGSDVKYALNLTEILFDQTGPITNLSAWIWNWECSNAFCSTVDYCNFFLNGYTPQNSTTHLNITIQNTVTAFGLKFAVTLYGLSMPSILTQNNRVDFVYNFTCIHGSCGSASDLSALRSAALFSDDSNDDFAIFSILGGEFLLSTVIPNGNNDPPISICTIDSLGGQTGNCDMSNFALVLDQDAHVLITATWNTTQGANALILDPTVTVTGQTSSSDGWRTEVSLVLLVLMFLVSFF